MNLHEHETAQKRGGATRLLSLDVLSAERDLPGAPDAAVAAFEREWALVTLERALGRLRQEYADGRRQGPAEPFLAFFGLDEAPSYAEAATQAGVTVLLTGEVTDSYHELRLSPPGVSFLTDAIILQRYFEQDGHLRRLMSVVKLRGCGHSTELVPYELGPDGIVMGTGLKGHVGILVGEAHVPERKGKS